MLAQSVSLFIFLCTFSLSIANPILEEYRIASPGAEPHIVFQGDQNRLIATWQSFTCLLNSTSIAGDNTQPGKCTDLFKKENAEYGPRSVSVVKQNLAVAFHPGLNGNKNIWVFFNPSTLSRVEGAGLDISATHQFARVKIARATEYLFVCGELQASEEGVILSSYDISGDSLSERGYSSFVSARTCLNIACDATSRSAFALLLTDSQYFFVKKAIDGKEWQASSYKPLSARAYNFAVGDECIFFARHENGNLIIEKRSTADDLYDIVTSITVKFDPMSSMSLVYDKLRKQLIIVSDNGKAAVFALSDGHIKLKSTFDVEHEGVHDLEYDSVSEIVYAVSVSGDPSVPLDRSILKFGLSDCKIKTTWATCVADSHCGWSRNFLCIYRQDSQSLDVAFLESRPAITMGPHLAFAIDELQDIFLQASALSPDLSYYCRFSGFQPSQGRVVNDTTLACPIPKVTTNQDVSLEVYTTSGEDYGSLTVSFVSCKSKSDCRSCNSPDIYRVCQWYPDIDACGLPKFNGSFSCAPQLTSMSPLYGPKSGKSLATLFGFNFNKDSVDAILIGDFPCLSSRMVSSRAIECIIPPSTDVKGSPVHFATSLTSDQSVSLSFEYMPDPVFFSVTPVCGNLNRATSVEISGTNFLSSTTATVTLAGSECVIQAITDSLIQCTVQGPPTKRSGDVQIAMNSWTIPITARYFFDDSCTAKISSVSPTKGPLAGGTKLTMNGSYFDKSIKKIFLGDSLLCNDIVAEQDDRLTCITPPSSKPVVLPLYGSSDLSDIVVSEKAVFEYVSGPSILGFMPSWELLGSLSLLRIEGTQLDSGSNRRVSVAGLPCTIENVTESVLFCHLASSNVEITGPIVLSIDNANTQSESRFKYVSKIVEASITSILPNVGPVAGGTLLEITGKSLDVRALQWLKIGNNDCRNITIENETKATCRTPSAIVNGTLPISSGDSVILRASSALFTYKLNPVVHDFSPKFGLFGTDVEVKIFGENFNAGQKPLISIGENICDITKVDESVITCRLAEKSVGRKKRVHESKQLFKFELDGFVYYSEDIFTFVESPIVNSMSEKSGVLAGHTVVVLRGSSLGYIVPQVYIGTSLCNLTEIGQDYIFLETPPSESLGSFIVELRYPYATVAAPEKFTYVRNPTISGFQPMAGSPGSNLTVFGTNLDAGKQTVWISDAMCKVEFANATVLICKLGEGYGKGPVQLSVDGFHTSSADSFHFIHDNDVEGAGADSEDSGETVPPPQQNSQVPKNGAAPGVIVAATLVPSAVVLLVAGGFLYRKKKSKGDKNMKKREPIKDGRDVSKRLFLQQHKADMWATSEQLKEIERHLEGILLTNDIEVYQGIFRFTNAYLDAVAFFLYEKGHFFKVFEAQCILELNQTRLSELPNQLPMAGFLAEAVLPFYGYPYAWSQIGGFIDHLEKTTGVLKTDIRLSKIDVEIGDDFESNVKHTLVWLDVLMAYILDKSAVKSWMHTALHKVLFCIGELASHTHGVEGRYMAMSHIFLTNFVIPLLSNPFKFSLVDIRLEENTKMIISNVAVCLHKMATKTAFSSDDKGSQKLNVAIIGHARDLGKLYEKISSCPPDSWNATGDLHLPAEMFERFMLRSHQTFINNYPINRALIRSEIIAEKAKVLVGQYPDPLIKQDVFM